VATLGAVWWVERESPAHSAQRGTAPDPTQIETPAQVETAGSAAEAAGIVPERAVAPMDVQTAVDEHRERVAPPPTVARARRPGARSAPAREAARPAESAPDGPTPRAVHASSSAAQRGTESSGDAEDADPTQPGAAQPSKSHDIQATDLAEVEHLARVRRLLTTEPEQALKAARDGQKRFADGLFAEERAGLIVFALARLSRTDDTLREARNFLRAYPAGPFAARVREIVTRLEGSSP